MIRLYPICAGCGENCGIHRNGDDFYCDACADDEIGIPEPGSETDESDDWFGVPGGRGMDDARDRWEEESLGL